MTLYCGIDLHSIDCFVSVINDEDIRYPPVIKQCMRFPIKTRSSRKQGSKIECLSKGYSYLVARLSQSVASVAGSCP